MQETQEMWVQFLGQEMPWKREWLPTPVFLPEKSHGRRSLAGYSPWGLKESEMTEQLSAHALALLCAWMSMVLHVRKMLNLTNVHPRETATVSLRLLRADLLDAVPLGDRDTRLHPSAPVRTGWLQDHRQV